MNYVCSFRCARRRGYGLWPIVLSVMSICNFVLLYVDGFNLDLSSAVTHQGEAGSMFGFTVLQHTDRGKFMVLVGAPEAQTAQPDVTKGGSVFKCSISQPVCQEVIFDPKGSTMVNNPQSRMLEPLDDKSGQWFGATMTASGVDGSVAVCAPRYVYFSPSFSKREPVGTCYVGTESLTEFAEYSPCRQGSGSSGYHQQGSCQAGFSAAMNRDGSRLFLGAPGTWYWQGQAHSLAMKVKEELATAEGPPSMDDSYLGYSTVVGEFTGDKQNDVAVGMPRGYNLTGAVILFDMQLRNLFNVSGEQMGSYFGYALAVVDINNDKLDDLIVGAPLFANFSSNDNSFEKGRIYVYYQKASHRFSSPDVLDGEYNRGRLGMALSSAGDLNLDGFGDFAAGAPYAGEEGRGIVYIYMGGKNGVVAKATQAIQARDIDVHLNTFGFSLAGGTDLDGNMYPDLVVGAYKSDRAVVLKSRPVVTVTTLLDMPTTINLENKGNCMLRNGTRVSCFVLNTFVQYSGVNVPDNLAIEVETILDASSQIPRAFFQHPEGQSRLNTTYELAKNQQRNNSVYVYIPNSFRDKLSPIKMVANYRILDERYQAQLQTSGGGGGAGPQSRQKRDIGPILDQLNSTSVAKQIRIGNKCGPDNICYPDLRLSARESSGVREYVLGKSDPLTVDVEIDNKGEDSFETMFFLNLPQGIDYVRVQPSPSQPNIVVTCTHRGNKGENVVMCDVGNPLSSGENAKFKIFLAPMVSQLGADTLNFSAKVNSSNEERPGDQRNNALDFRLRVFADASLMVEGKSWPEQLRYCIDCIPPSTYTDEFQIGPGVRHVYTIYNNGPSTVSKAQVRIVWPSYTRNKMHLLYIMEEPHIDGPNTNCSKVPANVANVAIALNESMGFIQRDRLRKPTSSSRGSRAGEDEPTSSAVEDRDGRSKRQDDAASGQARLEWSDPQRACGASECLFITCDIGTLMEREQVTISIRARLWADSLRKLQFDGISVSSKALVNVQSLAFGVKPRTHQHSSIVVKTEVVPSDPAQVKAGIAWWIILVGILIGLLLLVILIVICWKCGFFRRKRPGMDNNGNGVATRAPPPPTNGRSTASGGGTGNGNTPYYAYRYDYADNKYYPERAPGDAYL